MQEAFLCYKRFLFQAFGKVCSWWDGETLEHHGISRMIATVVVGGQEGCATFGKFCAVHVWKWSTRMSSTLDHALSCFGTAESESVLIQAVFRLFWQMVTGSQWDQTPELKLGGLNESMNEWMNFLWGKKKNIPMTAASLFWRSGLQRRSSLLGEWIHRDCFKVFPRARLPFLPGRGDPVDCAKTQYHMFLDFSPAPTGNHQQLKCFHKFRCLPELQVMRSGSHTNREEVLYRVHLISTQGEIRTENWKRKLKK